MSNKRLIRRTHKNDVLQAIRSRGLDPAEFEWSEVPGSSRGDQVVSQLTHRPTGYYFVFDYADDAHYCRRSPGGDGAYDSQYPGSWDGQKVYMDEWVLGVAEEYGAPDLWSAVTEERALISAAATAEENEPFDDEEKEGIRSFVEELSSYIRTSYALDDDRFESIERQLNYLVQAAERQGRREWLLTTVGVLVTIVYGAALAPEQAADLFRTAAQLLKIYLQVKGLLP